MPHLPSQPALGVVARAAAATAAAVTARGPWHGGGAGLSSAISRALRAYGGAATATTAARVAAPGLFVPSALRPTLYAGVQHGGGGGGSAGGGGGNAGGSRGGNTGGSRGGTLLSTAVAMAGAAAAAAVASPPSAGAVSDAPPPPGVKVPLSSLSSWVLPDNVGLTPPPPGVPAAAIMEPVTRAIFLTALPDGAGVLVGAGVRAMTPLKVKVYALGLYADHAALVSVVPAAALASTAEGGAAPSVTAADLLGMPAVWTGLCAPRAFPATLRLVVAREVTGAHMLHGFERALKPRLRVAAKAHDHTDGKAGMAAFTGWWKKVGTLPVGTEVTLSRDGAGRVTMAIKGEPVGAVVSDALAWALWDMFLGAGGVSVEIRQGIADGLARLLRGEHHK
ncbi:hypothetical protein MMPV_003991 [Pyropia vietnamensis]